MARLAIADVTERNPNVNYELGLAHALGLPTIIISQNMEDVPFDYRHRRCILYKTNEARWEVRLTEALRNTIAHVLKNIELKNIEADHDLRWPYEAHDDLRLFELAITKLDQFIRASLATPADRIWTSEPSEQSREVLRLEAMIALLEREKVTDHDRGLLLRGKWLIARAISKTKTESDEMLLREAKSMIADLFIRIIKEAA
jgi:hypothetical protein